MLLTSRLFLTSEFRTRTSRTDEAQGTRGLSRPQGHLDRNPIGPSDSPQYMLPRSAQEAPKRRVRHSLFRDSPRHQTNSDASFTETTSSRWPRASSGKRRPARPQQYRRSCSRRPTGCHYRTAPTFDHKAAYGPAIVILVATAPPVRFMSARMPRLVTSRRIPRA